MTQPESTELFPGELTVCIDFASLPTCVGIAPTLDLSAEFGISIDWLPLTGGLQRLSTAQPAQDTSDTSDPLVRYKARRAAARQKWAETELARNCERLGISVEAGRRQFDSTLLNLGLLFLNKQASPATGYVQRAFSAVFVEGFVEGFGEGLAVEQVNVVAALLRQETGLETAHDAFASFVADSQSRVTLEDLQQRLLAAGVGSSPAYVCQGEVFQGRQHLPMLRWMLGGRKGVAPV